MKLSVIIPFVGEYPQVLFTIQSLAQQLINHIDFEIIAVDNWCEQVRRQVEKQAGNKIANISNSKPVLKDIYDIQRSIPQTHENKAGEAVKACAKGNYWLKYVHYHERLSHWQAKRAGVEESTGNVLLFLDAHVITGPVTLTPRCGGITGMFYDYIRSKNNKGEKYFDISTFHMPLTYKILEWHRLIYKMVIDSEYYYTYSFTSMPENIDIFEVPVMSACGVMINREIYDKIGGFPIGLGIYGGGENFLNYTLSVTGYKKYIYPNATCFHHGEKRDYHYIYDDFIKNRLIAHYLFGGKNLCFKLLSIMKGERNILKKYANQVIEEHEEHRNLIKSIQKYDIEEWTRNWYPIRKE